MIPADVVARLPEVLGADASVTHAHGVVAATVDRSAWLSAVTAVRDDPRLDARFFDVLLGTDLGDGTAEVVVRLWSVGGRHAVLLRTTCPFDDPHLVSLTPAFAGAAWHERQAAEMLGLVFDGHPALTPLLLMSELGHPLRKDVVLADRQVPWPGAVEPGESTPNPRRVPPGAAAPGGAR